MSAWLALLDLPLRENALAADLAAAVLPGGPEGDRSAAVLPGGREGDLSAAAREHVLVAWLDADRRPYPQARRVDPCVLDPAGTPAHLSLLWPGLDALPLFDDPAVVAARRAARRLPAPRAVSTLTVDARHFAGSLWVADTARALQDDPFRLLGVPLRLQVQGGLLGRAHTLVGPAQERYSGAPWPGGRFGA